MESLREKRVWNGTSPEGLNYEITFWGEGTMCDGHGMWNYYVTVSQDQLRPEDWEKVWLPVESKWKRSDSHEDPTYAYWGSVLDSGDFHGGITFYEKGAQVDGTRCWIKVGCDYGHAWDRDVGYGYDIDDVRRDALNTCRKLAEILRPLARCGFTGQFFDPRFNMAPDVPGWKGAFLSPAGLGAKSAWARKDRERETA